MEFKEATIIIVANLGLRISFVIYYSRKVPELWLTRFIIAIYAAYYLTVNIFYIL
ncbi:hypothetical protein C2G38_2256787 [Gigaspora rosea]|uniref:Uncharacterized protein n=1 Tax=Gigaspora rosea TaxID=44941 RepID=A0A397TQT5_9GLOM|nr:hypothetical protein C2G38_2256787 [Gigaspora rosea]